MRVSVKLLGLTSAAAGFSNKKKEAVLDIQKKTTVGTLLHDLALDENENLIVLINNSPLGKADALNLLLNEDDQLIIFSQLEGG